jgi:hypothetical protein
MMLAMTRCRPAVPARSGDGTMRQAGTLTEASRKQRS